MVLSLHIHFQIGIFFPPTLYLVFRLPQIFTFNNHIRQQNSLLRGKKTPAAMRPGCVAAQREMWELQQYFTKTPLYVQSSCLLKLIQIQQGAFSTLAKLCVLLLLLFFASAEHFQRFSVIKPSCVKWHSVQSSNFLCWKNTWTMGFMELNLNGI